MCVNVCKDSGWNGFHINMWYVFSFGFAAERVKMNFFAL